MGYHTSYSLFAYPISDPKIADEIANALRKFDIINYALDWKYRFTEDGVEFGAHDPVEWYESDEEMRVISKEFPDIHFELHGEGEMNDDIWTRHFVNGKAQLCMAEIVIPPFDPEKLK